MKIYLIRHGETPWNKQQRFQGQVDIPLNDYGRLLARATAYGMPNIPYTHVYSSPLVRAVETAQLLLNPEIDSSSQIVSGSSMVASASSSQIASASSMAASASSSQIASGSSMAASASSSQIASGSSMAASASSPIIGVSRGQQIIVTDVRLKEMGFGKHEGDSIADALNDTGHPLYNFLRHPDAYCALPGAENFLDVIARARSFFKDVLEPLEVEERQTSKQENVLITAHGAFIRACVVALGQKSLADFWNVLYPNCCVTCINLVDGHYMLEYESQVFYDTMDLKQKKIV